MQIKAADLFAGCGGLSEGARKAGVEVVWAGNHSPLAVKYHSLNHPNTIHVCQDLHQANWAALPHHDLLLAAPCCQGHSPARGKDRPHHDTQRSTAWAVVSCAEYHREELIIVENVPAFKNWQLYPVWLQAMNALGYSVSPHIIDAANHGLAQNRERLFLICTKSKNPLLLNMHAKEHVGVNTVIKWDDYEWTPIYKKGRSLKTIARIESGRKKFGDRFVAPFNGSGSGTTGRDILRPIGTITTVARWSVINGDMMRMLKIPEAKMIMGFDQSYLLPQSEKEAYQLMGNAVCPPVIEDILTEIARIG